MKGWTTEATFALVFEGRLEFVILGGKKIPCRRMQHKEPEDKRDHNMIWEECVSWVLLHQSEFWAHPLKPKKLFINNLCALWLICILKIGKVYFWNEKHLASLVVSWLLPCTSNAGGTGLVSGWGFKILHATAQPKKKMCVHAVCCIPYAPIRKALAGAGPGKDEGQQMSLELLAGESLLAQTKKYTFSPLHTRVKRCRSLRGQE